MQSTSTKRIEVPHKEVSMGDILTTTTREDSTQPLGEKQLLSSLINKEEVVNVLRVERCILGDVE